MIWKREAMGLSLFLCMTLRWETISKMPCDSRQENRFISEKFSVYSGNEESSFLSRRCGFLIDYEINPLDISFIKN